MTTKLILAVAATLTASAGMAQMSTPPMAPSSTETTRTTESTTSTTGATAPDGVALESGKWVKDGRPATAAEIKLHKQWMTQNGMSTTGTPDA